MSGITTHVLDTSKGRPAMGVPIKLEVKLDHGWKTIGEATTNSDGRAPDLIAAGTHVKAGIYRIVFETGIYFANTGTTGFYPTVPVIFEITNPEQHHHVPLLLSPFGYSTYRGS